MARVGGNGVVTRLSKKETEVKVASAPSLEEEEEDGAVMEIDRKAVVVRERGRRKLRERKR